MNLRPVLLVIYLSLLLTLMFSACRRQTSTSVSPAERINQNENKLTELIIYDIFTPPVAARIYAYASLATYEAVRFKDSSYISVTAQLHDFGKMPVPVAGKKYDYSLAASTAFFTVTHKVVFSIDSLKEYEDNIYGQYRTADDDSVYTRSVSFGKAVAAVILKRASTDNYPQTRGKPRFMGEDLPGKWRPTPPDYQDGVEFCWGTMHTFVTSGSSQFLLPAPPVPGTDSSSPYMKQNLEVYNHSRHMTEAERDIARYWDDNPFVLQHSGHMMFANKKITPGGHWIGITAIASRTSHASEVKTAAAYAMTSVAMFDAFISCWQVKYLTSYIRPVTVINASIDKNWLPFLQTPPFPEYPSGHSTITRAAATVLTGLFGRDFSFQDTSDLRYIGMQRHFTSFVQAADEASISRFYGGIHYLNSVNQGAIQGKEVSDYINSHLHLRK